MGSSPSPAEIERIATEDGARIALKRRPGPGTPVILLHGIAVHADMWDVPLISGRDFEFRGFSHFLNQAGFDVWLPNFRGHGTPEFFSAPAPEQRDWTVDHFILHDLPAVIDHVAATTHRTPYVVGVSMGAMVLGGYLQGARFEEPGSPSRSGRIVVDQELSRRRQSGIRGAVFMTYPAALRWPRGLHDSDGRPRWREMLRDWNSPECDNNYPFEIMAHWAWLETLLAAAGEVPLDWLRSGAAGRRLKLPSAVNAVLEKSEKAVLGGLLRIADKFTGARNHRVEVMLYGRRHVIESVKSGVLRQMAKSVRQGGFVSAMGDPEHVYSDHYHHIELPVLVVAGGRDRIASLATTREVFFERINSTDKTFQIYESLGHGEFTAAPVAAQLVFPAMTDWILARNARD